MWDLENPQHREQALQYLYSLPDNEENSDEDADDSANEEIDILENIDSSTTVSASPSTSGLIAPESPLEDHLLISTSPEMVSTLEEDDEISDIEDNEEPTTWITNCEHLHEKNIEVYKPAEASDQFPPHAKEIDYFTKIFSDDILNLIVEQTNMYASQDLPRKSNKKEGVGPSKNWQSTSTEEIKALLGVMIIMGIHQLPHLANYWSSDPILSVSSVSQVLSSKRYKKLIENIHLNDNTQVAPKGQPGYDKLHKVRPLITKLNDSFGKPYKHSNTLAVDESMIAFKGRSSIKQYMPMKPVKRGYKVWCLADSTTGYICKFDVYTGKATDAEKNQYGLGERVVINLTTSLKNQNCIVAFDNFFSSIGLMEKLLRDGIFALGTVRANRKNLPDIYKDKTKMQRGEFMFETKGKISAVKWMDSKFVYAISNYFCPKETTTVLRRNKTGERETVYCPKVIAEYNKIMGGVDKFDQLHERYAVGRRSTKWWHRIFYYLVDMAIVNSFILMNTARKRTSDQLTFRINLARQLVDGYSSRKRRNKPVLFLANKRAIPEEVRLSEVGKHLPIQNQTYKRCRLCSTKAAEKRTRYSCSSCQVPLCIQPCFNRFHGK